MILYVPGWRVTVCTCHWVSKASDVLHQMSQWKHLDVRTIQAEDEIAAMGATIGAAYGGALAATGTSGPGVCLKSEAINLAIMLELPLVILDVQRGGPSTGLPTKTEQTDLLQAMFGRNGESPLPVLAPASPKDCFDTAIEAFRIAVRHMTPVFILSEGFLANGSEPWRIPSLKAMQAIGAPLTGRDLGFPQSFFREIVLHSREVRDRFTMLDLAADAGLIEGFADECR